MHRKFLQPLAVAISLALSAGSAFAASSFDVTELDKTISPCNDFNGFVNAKWVAKNPIPADRTRWGAFDQLREHSLETQHDIAEKAAKDADSAKAGSIEQKIGWFYRSGMDEAAVEKAGYDPIKADLAKIDALKTPADIVALDDRQRLARPRRRVPGRRAAGLQERRDADRIHVPGRPWPADARTTTKSPTTPSFATRTRRTSPRC